MRRAVLSVLSAAVLTCALLAGACASSTNGRHAVAEGSAEMVSLGEYFDTDAGQVFVLRVQDEFRLIRCIPEGPIAGCYEDVFAVADDDVRWNTWIDIAAIPGLRVSFVSPTEIAVARPTGK